MEIVDNAQQTHYFNNSVIEPKGKYWYDALYRLVKATGRENETIAAAPGQADLTATTGIPHNNGANHLKNYTQTFEYDKLGNIGAMKNQGQWTRNYYYDTINKNRLTSHDDTSQTVEYTYDAHGNMLSMPGIPTMEWDYADQLHKAISGTSTAFYNYDLGGNRVRKVVEKSGGIKEVRIYCGNFEVYCKYQNDVLSMERTTTHISDESGKIATTELLTIENENPINNSATIRYQYSNHLGSASLELDENANIISYEEYHPFGTTSYQKHNTDISQKRYKYVGKERDEETGLYYYGARYYAPWIARFISVDPLQHSDKNFKYSSYTYVKNNPINFIDPDGMEWDETNRTKEIVDNYKTQIGKKRKRLERKQGKLETIQNKFDEGSESYNSYQIQIDNIDEKIDELNTAESELTKMGDANDVTYSIEWLEDDTTTKTYKNTESGKFQEKVRNDNTTFKDGKVVMKYNRGDYASLSHELKHGHQFLRGEISFNSSGGPGLLYDLTDEQAAWKRGSVFEGSLTNPLVEPTIKKLRGMDSYKHIKSENPLNMYSTMKDINKGRLPDDKVKSEVFSQNEIYGKVFRYFKGEINRFKQK